MLSTSLLPITFFQNEKSRLIQLSFLMFFLELVLIRWIGANIFSLAFFSNFVLIASFLGLGVGFLHSKSNRNLFHFTPLLLTLLFICCYHFHYQYQINLNQKINDLSYLDHLFNKNLFPIVLTLPVMFIMVTIVMAAIGDGLGKSFSQFPSLIAYRLDILGSLAGIITFTLCSYYFATPIVWSSIIGLALTSLLWRDLRTHKLIFLIQVIVILGIFFTTLYNDHDKSESYWSPYYKIVVEPYADQRYAILANGMPQQFIESVEQRKKYKPFYFLPYQHIQQTTLNNVLIIGAGTGGDIAIALAQGAQHIDAVEIDPVLYQIGKKYNPDHPYDNPKVHRVINDGRVYLQQSKRLYDLILFALPDSLLVISGQSSLRLENYLFTIESITQVAKHLQPNGVFAMYNYYREPWLVDRLANTLTQTFNHKPCVDSYGPANLWLSVLTISKSSQGITCPTLWRSNSNITSLPSTDDHPFLYLKDQAVSGWYIYGCIFILGIAFLAVKSVGGSYRSIKNYPIAFLMGAAFFLLETKNISNFALLFGSTWLVNSLVFTGILLNIYLAIEVVNHWRKIPTMPLYFLLLATLALAWFIKSNDLLMLPILSRYTAAVVIAFSPIFIANILFAEQFRHMSNSSEAFSVNLLGTVLGGLLEYSTLLIGNRNLLILSAVIYTLAIVIIAVNTRRSLQIT